MSQLISRIFQEFKISFEKVQKDLMEIRKNHLSIGLIYEPIDGFYFALRHNLDQSCLVDIKDWMQNKNKSWPETLGWVVTGPYSTTNDATLALLAQERQLQSFSLRGVK